MLSLQKMIQKVLQDNGWGIYHKIDALEKMKAQEGLTFYKVNEVELSKFLDAFKSSIDESIENKEK